MEQIKIGNRIKNMVIRLVGTGSEVNIDAITTNEPYTILKDIQTNFTFSEKNMNAKNNFNVLNYNTSKLSNIVAYNVPLTDKIMNLLFYKSNNLKATLIEDVSSDNNGKIFLNKVSSKDTIYNLFLHDSFGKVYFIDSISADEIIIPESNTILKAIYEVPAKGWMLSKPDNFYVNIDMEIVGNDSDNTKTFYAHAERCSVKPNHELRFTKELSNVDLDIIVLGDSWISTVD